MIGVSALRPALGVVLLAALAASLSGCPPVDPLVDVDFDASPIAGFAPLLVQFKADVTYRPSTTTPGRFPNEVTDRPTVRTYFWTFGDGTTGTGEVTTHLYRRAGAYSVTLSTLVEEQSVAENGAVSTQTYLVSEYKPVYVKVFGPSEQPPVANAGPAQTIQLGESATLDGRQSFDPDGDPLTFTWVLTNAPQGSELDTGDLLNADTAQPGVTPDVAGAYTFTLTVSDGDETDTDTTTVVVEAPGNKAPIANAGPDQTVFLRTLVNLDGSGSSDPDGQPLSFRWTILEAPQGSNAALVNSSTATPQIQVDAFGQFVVQLIVNDSQTDSAPDTVVITVVNQQPIAAAGNDQTVVVGQATQLDGTGSIDPENLPLSFAWTVTANVNPPSKGENFTLEGENTATPTFTALVPGTYTATLVVNDGLIDSAPDSVLLSTDTNPPQIQYPTGNINGATINSECGDEFDEPTALDPEEGDVTDRITRTGEVDIHTPGTYNLTYFATDSSGNTSAAFTLTVNVIDTTPPAIALIEGDLTLQCNQPFNDPGATAIDLCEGTVAVTVGGDTVDTTSTGTFVLTYSAIDGSGNASATLTRTVTVIDTVAPELTLLGDTPMVVECNTPFVDPGARAVDACEGEVPVQVQLLANGGKGTQPVLVDTSSPGTFVLEYTAQDSAGNVAVPGIRTVEVVDTQAPLLVAVNGTAFTVECGAEAPATPVTAQDACEGDLTAQIAAAGDVVDTSAVGTYELTFNVSDGAGNAAEQLIITVAVVDTTPPVLTLNGDAAITQECTTPFTDPGAVATDGCAGDVPVTIGGDVVDTSSPGVYTLTYNATDPAGNAAPQLTRTVTIIDTTPPVITRLGAAQINVECGSVFTDPGATAADACAGNVPVTVGGDTVDTASPGLYVIRYTAVDPARNAATPVTRQVTVVDTTPPVITRIGAASLTVECGSPFVDPGATAVDVCEGNVPVTTGGNAVDTGAPGDYTITYNAVDGAGNAAAQVTRTVTVVDTTAPVISLIGAANLDVECNSIFADPGATALDSCEGDVPVQVALQNISAKGGVGLIDTSILGTRVLVYTATDTAGNAAEPVTRVVNVVDNRAPVITLNGLAAITVMCGTPFLDPGATAQDECAGALPVTVGGDTVDTGQTGTYVITYDAADPAGNEAAQVTRTVTVEDTIAPVITLIGDETITVECGSQFTDPGAEVNDNCDDVTLVVGGDTVDTAAPGDYTITYDAADLSGNAAAQVTRTVTVVDTTAPVITLVGSDPVIVECGAAFTDPGATATDVCEGDVPVTTGGDTVDTSSPGDYVITYDAEDGAGNAAVQVTRAVTVVDTQGPVISLLGDADMTVECRAEFVDPGATALDQCEGPVGVDVALQDGGSKGVVNLVDTAVPGVYVLEYTAQDSAGNAAAPVTRTVTVEDTTPPVVSLVDGDLTLECGTPFVDPGATAVDICDLTAPVTAGGDTVDTSTPGLYVVSYTATDAAGNTSTPVTRNVTVEDTTPPVIAITGDNPLTVQCGSVFTDPGATASDTCEGTVPVTTGGDAVDTSALASYVVTYDAVDGAGNAATQVFRTVIVVDTVGPEITLLGDNPLEVQCGEASYIDPGALAVDACEGPVQVTVGGDFVDTFSIGTYTITFDAEDSLGNPATQVTRTVNVVDTTPPTIELLGEPEMTFECGSENFVPGAFALDNCDFELPVDVGGDEVDFSTLGVYVVTYDATDSAGNEAQQVTRTVNVVDTEGPFLSPIDGDITVECSSVYDEPGVFAFDSCEGQITDIDVTGTVDTTTPGNYVLTYTAQDRLGNEGTATRTVTVEDTLAPIITLNEGDVTIYCNQDFTEAGATAGDVCDGNLSAEVVIGGDTVDTSTPGTYDVTYEVTDSSGNTTQQSRVVTVLGPCGGDDSACPDDGTTLGTCVFTADFETGDDGFTGTGLWHRTDACAGPLQPLGPSFVQYFGEDIDCDYDTGNVEQGEIDSPVIDLSAFIGGTVTLRFDYLVVTENFQGSDNARVWVSTDGGSSFTPLAENAPLDQTPLPLLCDGGAPGADGDPNPQWETALIDISSAAGEDDVVIRFSFDTVDTDFNGFLGFAVDNICVSAAPGIPGK